MDVLLIDENDTPVVVECKQNAPTLGDIRQLRNYMAQIKKDLRKAPRGILVHGGARPTANQQSIWFNTILRSRSHARRNVLPNHAVDTDAFSARLSLFALSRAGHRKRSPQSGTYRGVVSAVEGE